MPRRAAPVIALIAILAFGIAAAANPTGVTIPDATRPVTSGNGAARHRVDLGGNRFVPRQLRIAVGDTVDFVNGAGGPHNVAFWPDSLPTGSRDQISRLLPDSIAPLTGSLLFEEEQTWTMAFDGVPPGRYPYYCLPHIVGGMVGEVVVGGQR